MKISINGNLPRNEDIDGVPPEFLIPAEKSAYEQLDISMPAKPRTPAGKYTPYQERIRDCFAKAYNFLDSHKHPREREDFTNISINIGKVGGTAPDPLLKALLVAAYEELEREYISAGNTGHEKTKASVK